METQNKRDHDINEKSLLKSKNKKIKNKPLKISRDYKYKGIFKMIESQGDCEEDILLSTRETIEKRNQKNREEKVSELPDENYGVLDFIEQLGLNFAQGVKRIMRGPKKAVKLTAMLISSVFRILFLLILKLLNLVSAKFISQLKALAGDIKKIKERKTDKKTYENADETFSFLIKKGFKRHKELFKTFANIAMPLAAVLAFAFTVKYWSGVTFALEVKYDDKSIGYIENEEVYETAKAAVEDRMSTGKGKKTEIKKPSYSLSLVSLNELIDSDVLSDRIIESSSDDLTNACGIYIDDEFICAIKNETDATSVFHRILEPYEKKIDDENSFVDFVEKVEYVQGLYPNNDDTIWDASRLIDTLSKTKESAVEYTVKDGDTIYDIAIKNDISLDDLLSLNPGKDKNLFPGDKITLSKEVNYIRVKVMKTETHKVEVDFETEESNNPSMYKGTKKTVREGEKGEDKVTELVTYVDGVRVSSQELSRERVKEPVSEKVQVGSKSASVSGMGGNLTVSNMGFVWPAPACRSVSSYFGWRTLFGKPDFHTGVDLIKAGARGASKGAVIVASLDGTVESVRRGDTGYGHNVVINHGGGLKTRYAHCLPGSISVSVGQKVRAGQAIARVGKSGTATGYHLHFEIIVNGQCVNPLPYIS